jgi:hypothetical protein
LDALIDASWIKSTRERDALNRVTREVNRAGFVAGPIR